MPFTLLHHQTSLDRQVRLIALAVSLKKQMVMRRHLLGRNVIEHAVTILATSCIIHQLAFRRRLLTIVEGVEGTIKSLSESREFLLCVI